MRGVCKVCGEEREISLSLGVCRECIRERFEEARPYIERAHERARSKYDLPSMPPSPPGVRCIYCANECEMDEGEIGYCGLRKVVDGRLVHLGDINTSVLDYYLDPHPTNCCATWFCPGGTGVGYPRYSVSRRGPEHGCYNLAVFFYGCNFDCLFCQNYSHKEVARGGRVSRDELIKAGLRDDVTCICYFGGSPEPQLPFAIRVSEEMIEDKEGILRICWEWNGCGNRILVKKAAELSFRSGGIIKFDLKASSREMSIALSGVDNKRAFENFEMIFHEFYQERREIPLLTATTLLVPGYVDEVEVGQIADFLADLDPEIPYSLLVFYPQFEMNDLPITPINQVKKAYKEAKKRLRNVHIGNLHLLSFSERNLKVL